MIVVLAVASLCLAEPEADALHYYAPYVYPYAYRHHFVSSYAGPLIGGYHAVTRFHKREAEAEAEAEADPAVLFQTSPLPAAAFAAPVAHGPLVAPIAAPVAPPIALPIAHAVAHAPVVKSVVE